MSPVPVAQALREWGLRRSDPWYHQTPMRRRLAIQRHGLIPRRPTEHNYADLAGEERIDAQPCGVYVTLRCSDRWGYEACRHGERVARFAIEPALIADLPVQHDPLISDALVILARVPPAALTYLPLFPRARRSL